MFPSTWIERMPRIPGLDRVRAWFEPGPGRPELPEFTVVSLGLWCPPVDVVEMPGAYVLRAEVPGVRPDHLHVRLERGLLTVSGRRAEVREGSETGYPIRERSSGSFSRSMRLPRDARAEEMEVELESGVLTVRIPRFDSASPPASHPRF